MKESILKEHLLLIEEILQIIVVMTVDHTEDEDILVKEEDSQRKRGIQTVTEDPQGEEDYPVMEDPQIDMEEDHPKMEDHLMEEDHLMKEDHLMEETP